MAGRKGKQLSVGDLIEQIGDRFAGSGLFYGHGTDNAQDETVYLVFGALDIPFDAPDSIIRQTVDPARADSILALADKRIHKRVPIAYLINKAWFAGLQFYVDERVLIPRSPVAELIEERFSPWVDESRVNRILDIGTGSGCIAVACALAFPHAVVDAIDVSPAALEVAQINVSHYGLGGRVNLILSDLYEQLQDNQYDLVVANPPYVSNAEMSSLPAEYRHEPGLALQAGQDGLAIVQRILAESTRHLRDGGILVVETGSSESAVAAAFPELPFTWLDFERGGEGVFLLMATDL